jgi:hypothetical protein
MRCDHCPASAACLGESRPAICARAADPSEAGFRKRLRRSAAASAVAVEFPSLAAQARGLAGAVGRFVASGARMVPQEEQARRLAICHECPEFSRGKCTICGCVARWKARLSSEHCPDSPPRW